MVSQAEKKKIMNRMVKIQEKHNNITKKFQKDPEFIELGLKIGRVLPRRIKLQEVKEVKKMPKKRGPGRPKKRGRPKGSGKKVPVKKKPMTQKERVIAKAMAGKRVSLAQVQQTQAMISRKPPTSSIMMHGAKYILHDKTARTKPEAQKVRQKLKAQGMAAFINPRKRKAGTQWFVYKKPRVKVAQAVKQKVSKRTGIPTGSINMHGRKYDLYDDKPRTKAQAQAVRKRLVKAGKSAFLNPRRRKSGTEYFVYTKQAERKRKTPSPKKPSPKRKPSPRKKTATKSRSAIIKELEAELRRIKAMD